MRENLLNASRKQLKSFGLWVGLVVAILGAWLLWQGHSFIWLTVGLLLILLGWIVPRWLKPLYIPWMGLAIVLGFVMTRVLLTVLFFLVITPVGLIMRWTGRDPLNRKPDPSVTSYWTPKPPHADLKKHLERFY